MGAAIAGLGILAPYEALAAHPSELASAFVITKSSNRNQVSYSVELDQACAPIGPDPVRPYWRMLERGPAVTQSLSDSEERVLGVSGQEVAGQRVRFALRGMPGRSITVDTERAADGQCTSLVQTTIAGVPALLGSVYVQQRLFGIEYVLLTGRALDGTAVQERITQVSS